MGISCIIWPNSGRSYNTTKTIIVEATFVSCCVYTNFIVR